MGRGDRGGPPVADRVPSSQPVLLLSLLAVVVLVAPRPSGATSFPFSCITNNNVTDCNTGQSQLHLDVTSPGAGQIQFELTNVGASQSTIAGVYWDEGGLLGSIASISMTGVSF